MQCMLNHFHKPMNRTFIDDLRQVNFGLKRSTELVLKHYINYNTETHQNMTMITIPHAKAVQQSLHKVYKE